MYIDVCRCLCLYFVYLIFTPNHRLVQRILDDSLRHLNGSPLNLFKTREKRPLHYKIGEQPQLLNRHHHPLSDANSAIYPAQCPPNFHPFPIRLTRPISLNNQTAHLQRPKKPFQCR